MVQLQFGQSKELLRVLCLGAHSDDIEIGCGGTILRLLAQFRYVEVNWIVFSSGRERKAEALNSASQFLAKATRREVTIRNFPGSFFPFKGEAIKAFFERVKRQVSPDIIFTHYRHDLHQDHRVVSDFTWNTWRNHLILEYEIPKYDGDMGVPNMFIPLDEATVRTKARILMDSFKTQRTKQWFSEDTFCSLARIRGVECNSPERYAEAFYCRKATIQL
ncbi:MAG: PIG-L deacetylase family protein [Nitrospira sp.]|nr:PIG-L family deacetylase [Nitrospira sp.]